MESTPIDGRESRRRMMRRIVAGTCLNFLAVAVAVAQTPAQPDPPFMKDLERLAEILGSVHYLSAICSDDGTSPWRSRMEALIETEFRSPDLKSRAVARFNLGYQSYANIHSECTNAAEITLDRFLQEGADITEQVARRYGR